MFQCFLPTGMVMDFKVHKDDEMVQIKTVLICDATSNGIYIPVKLGLILTFIFRAIAVARLLES